LTRLDNSEIRVFDQTGKSLYSGTGDDLEIQQQGNGAGSVSYAHAIEMPGSMLQHFTSEPVHMEINYSLTLFKLNASYSLKASGDRQRMPGWGSCKSELKETGTAVELECLQVGKGPMCATVFLEHSPSGARNPENTACYPNYAPYKDRPIPDVMSRFLLVLPFHDPSGLTKYPVDHAKVSDSKVIIRMYTPDDRFTRIVRSPVLRGENSQVVN
jgi:hypothetical protein